VADYEENGDSGLKEAAAELRERIDALEELPVEDQPVPLHWLLEKDE
jgi:hypothetical protein